MAMHVAALYDIHGNLPALEAVLAEIDRLRPDRILIGGDVALGPLPRETLERLEARGEPVRFIRGNTDRELIEELEQPGPPERPWSRGIHWAAHRLSAPQRARLSALPETVTLEIDGLGPVLFCHGTPRDDNEIITRITPEARLAEILAGVPDGLIVCGHTHVQYDRVAAGRRIVNPGSVGMPFEGELSARWAMLGPEVSLMRTPYDFEAAIERIRTSGFPDVEEFVSRYLITPPAAEVMSAFFEENFAKLEAGERIRPPGASG